MDERRIDISVVVPCLNEEANVGLLAERLFAAAAEAGLATELVFVDDGSTDGTWATIEALGEYQAIASSRPPRAEPRHRRRLALRRGRPRRGATCASSTPTSRIRPRRS